MTNLLVNLMSVLLIGLIVYWFWLSKPRARKAETDTVDVLVDNGVYSPSQIEIPVGRVTKLRFLRKDASPCAEKVIIDTLGLSADLPLNEAVTVAVQPQAAGEYEFTCQMRMYRGNLIAK